MTSSGLRTILKDCLHHFSLINKNNSYEIIAFVPEKLSYPKIEYITLTKSKKSWFLRLYYEYIYFYFFSKNKNIDVWISLHDISPNVIAKHKITYFHNAIPFYKAQKLDWKYDFKIALFSKFYLYLYQINSKKLSYIIVQQQFIKKLFKEKGFKNIMVAQPISQSILEISKLNLNPNKLNFIYPSEPKVYKNHIVIAEALKLIPKEIQNKIEIYLTFLPETNKFSKYFHKKYGHLSSIKFIGWLPKKELYGYYQSVDALIFPSKLETWGLPISEIQNFQKPIVISNLDYANESLGNYDKVVFFNPENPQELALIFTKMVDSSLEFQEVNCESYPDFKDWNSLISYILK